MNIVCSTDNPEEVLNTVRRNKQRGIYFLDIHLGEDKKKEGIYLGEASDNMIPMAILSISHPIPK